MTQNILKKILFIQLMFLGLWAKAQEPIVNIDLNTDESGSIKNYIARDYIKLLPGFQYMPEGASQEYNPVFMNEILNLYDHFQDENIHELNTPKEMGQDAIDYINNEYPNDATDFIDFIKYSFDYDPSIPVYLPVAAKSFIAKIDDFMTFPAVYNQPETPFSTSSSQTVGSINGSAGVSPLGGATYQIPIKLPPGTAGMLPNLSIVYNSQSPGGMLGSGWTIGGFSAITRIPTNLHDDGFIDGVNFNANDKFALDGNRLVVTNGGTYGANGTEYHTQMETFSKITSLGSAGGGPEKFMVETKSGQILEYAYTTDARFVAEGRTDVLIWLLNKITDPNGNYYTISYHTESGEYWPKEIKYTANDNAGLQAYNSVKFYFDKKNDPSIGFVASSKINSSVILREMIIESDGSIVNRYEFKYRNDFSSKLNEIIYYAGNDKLNSTKINWGNKTTEFDIKTSNLSGNVDYIPGDYNADGKTDIAVIYKKTDANGMVVKQYGYTVYSSLYVYYSTGDGSNFTARKITDLDMPIRLLPGDFDGDGRADLLFQARNPVYHNNQIVGERITYGLYFIDDSSFEKVTFRAYGSFEGNVKMDIGDFDGDKKMDWMLVSESETDNVTLSTYMANPDGTRPTNANTLCNLTITDILNFKIADFNGNGKSDIMIIHEAYNNSCQIYEFMGSNTQLSNFHTSGFPTKDHRLFLGDFNGDGKTDLLTWALSVGWEIHYYGENDFIWTKFPETPNLLNVDPGSYYYQQDYVIYRKDNNYFIADYNGDGKSDILEQKLKSSNGSTQTYSMNLYYSKGITFENVYAEMDNVYLHQFPRYYANDFNGDGKSDAFLPAALYSENGQIVLFNPDSKERMLASITNGLNKETKFEYLPYTNNSVYLQGSGNSADNKVIEIRPPINVVYRIYEPTGIGSDFDYRTYWYKGLKLHKGGKGLLGFETVYSKKRYGFYEEQYFEYDPVFFNTYLSKLRNRNYSYTLETTFNNLTVAVGDKGFKTYIGRKTETDPFNNITISTNYGYDDFGNITEQVIDYNGEGTTTATNTYQTVNGWCNSELDISTITKTRQGKASYTRTVDNDYLNGHLSQTVSDAGTGFEIKTELKDYNAFGFPETIELSGSGITKTTKKEYGPKGRAVIKETVVNAYGDDFVTSTAYDYKTGNVLSEKNALGKETNYSYNSFGQLLQTTLPNEKKINTSTHWADGESPDDAVYYNKITKDGSGDIQVFYDIHGRKLREETIAFNGITKIYKDLVYDNFGRISKEYEACFAGQTANSNTYHYDTNTGKIQGIETPVGNILYEYSSRQTKTTQPSAQSLTKTINAYGDVLEATDNGGTISYDYNSAGLAESITTTGSGTISLVYDLTGNRTNITDPNAGTVSTTFDAFGNLLTQSDANGSYTMQYDNMGRIVKKTGTEGVTDYTYYGSGGGLGQIESIEYNNINKSFTYDNYGRLLVSTENIDNKNYTYSYTYDEFGREKTLTYPSGFGITNEYNNFGYLKTISQTGGNMIWQADNMNALGQYEQISKGNGKTTTYTYDAYHLPETVVTPGIAEFEYGFNAQTGNLEYRKDIIRNLREDFTYDNLNRLTGAKIEGQATNYLDLSFQANGNIATKTDAGTYTYDNTKLHAVTEVTNDLSFIPDEDDQIINYTAFNKIKDITEANYSLAFTYGADHQRRKTVLTEGGAIIKTKYFLGSYEEEITVANGTRKLHYISGGDGLAGVFIMDDANPTGKMYYTYADHLGSIVAITDDTGGLLEEYSYGPWGRRRNAETWEYEPIINSQLSIINGRGYTGHEHLYEFSLINMNGRLYDPILGRMLSPDNFIQAPGYTQNFNRYSYVLNNPLKYTDPSGELFGWDDAIVGGVGFAFGYLSHGISTGDWGWSAVGAGAIGAGTALLGYYSGGATSAASIAEGFSAVSGGHAATVALGYSGRMVVTSTISSLLPSASINIGDISLSVSPAFMIGGGGYSVGLNFQASYDAGDFTLGGALGTSYGKSGFTGITGTEIRLSGYAGYDDGHFGIGLSSTKFWSGETSQRLGRMSMRYNDFSMSYENDGTPFQSMGLGGGTDSYRTASVTLGYKDYTIGMLLFTGYRDIKNKTRPNKDYPYGMVGNPEINDYNAGILYLGHGNMRAGWNHDNIRHVFQNKFAHGIIKKQAWIPRKSWPNQPYLMYGTGNPYTNW